MFFLDMIIVLVLIFGFLIGFKRGFTRELVSLVGIVLITILAFIFKNPISVLLYKNLPFFKFNYLVKGSNVLNILLYEVIAFLIVFIVLFIVLKIIIKLTNLFETILKMTIVLGIPSKILGGVVGVLKSYIIVFIVLYIMSLPAFAADMKETKIGDFMLNHSAVLSDITGNSVKVYYEIADLIEEYKDKSNQKNFDQDALDLLIKYKAITKENAKDLIKNGKLKGVTVK